MFLSFFKKCSMIFFIHFSFPWNPFQHHHKIPQQSEVHWTKIYLYCRQNSIFFFAYCRACMRNIPSRVLHNEFCVASSYWYVKTFWFSTKPSKTRRLYANILTIILTGYRQLKCNRVTGKRIKSESNKLVFPGMGVFQKRFYF